MPIEQPGMKLEDLSNWNLYSRRDRDGAETNPEMAPRSHHIPVSFYRPRDHSEYQDFRMHHALQDDVGRSGEKRRSSDLWKAEEQEASSFFRRRSISMETAVVSEGQEGRNGDF